MHTQWLTAVRDKVNINRVKISTKHAFTEVEVNSCVCLPRYKTAK